MNVTLEWRANGERDLDHYVIYWGISSGSYTNSEIIPKDMTNYKVTGLTANTKYCFVVRAVDYESLESGDSREICWIKHSHTDDDGRDAEWEITSGNLRGFKFVYFCRHRIYYSIRKSGDNHTSYHPAYSHPHLAPATEEKIEK